MTFSFFKPLFHVVVVVVGKSEFEWRWEKFWFSSYCEYLCARYCREIAEYWPIWFYLQAEN